MNKVDSIQVLRGFAVLAVILYHLSAVQERYFGTNVFPQIVQHGGFGVDLFFVISGVVMFKSVLGKPHPPTPFSFIKARTARIYPAYWVVTCVIFVVASFYPELVNSSYESQPNLIMSLALIPDEGLPWLNVGWSLEYEMWFYLLLAVLLLTVRTAIGPIFMLYGLVLVALSKFVFQSPILALITDPLVLEFLLGFAAGKLFFEDKSSAKTKKLLVLSLISAAVASVSVSLLDSDQNERLYRFASYGLISVSIVTLFLYFNRLIEKSSLVKPLLFIGNISYSLYLTHVLCLNAVLFGLTQLLKLHSPILLVNLVCIGCIIVFGYLYFIVVEKTLTSQVLSLITKTRQRSTT